MPCPVTPPMQIRVSRRQREVARLLAAGLTVPEAAEGLGIAVSTAESHVEALSAKLPGRIPPIRKIVRWWLLEGTTATRPE